MIFIQCIQISDKDNLQYFAHNFDTLLFYFFSVIILRRMRQKVFSLYEKLSHLNIQHFYASKMIYLKCQ